MRVLVTGGGGFLGQSIVARLVHAGHEVRSFSRQNYPALTELGVAQIRGDLADPMAVKNAARGMEAVIHTAAKAGVFGPYEEYFRANVIGTENVLAACRDLGVTKLVYTSSPSVVFNGDDQEGVDESEAYPQRFLSAYSATKAAAERQVLAANSAALATVALRPHLIWGPGDPHLVPRVLQQARAGRLRLVGTGDKLVDAVYIDNAADAHVLALSKLSPGHRIAGQTIFVTNQEPLPMSEMINGILRAAGMPPVTKRVSLRAAYAAGWVFETLAKLLRQTREPAMTRFVAKQLGTAHWYSQVAAREGLGYIPTVSMAEGFRRLASHMGR